MSVELPEVITRYYRASNAHDAAASAGCFVDDASVRDEGREWRGAIEIRAWMEEIIAKYRLITEVVDATLEDDQTIVTVRVSGTFPGSPVELRQAFTLRGGRIARLAIPP